MLKPKNLKNFGANTAVQAALSVAKSLDIIQPQVEHTYLTAPPSFLFVSIRFHGLPMKKRRNNWLEKYYLRFSHIYMHRKIGRVHYKK